jgi:hypothetical protein
MTVLTFLPRSWSIQKVQEDFSSVLNHVVRRANGLEIDQGILFSSSPKLDKTVNEVVVKVVRSFYNSDEVSRASAW